MFGIGHTHFLWVLKHLIINRLIIIRQLIRYDKVRGGKYTNSQSFTWLLLFSVSCVVAVGIRTGSVVIEEKRVVKHFNYN